MNKDKLNFFLEKTLDEELLALLFLDSSRQLELKDEIVENLPLKCQTYFEKLEKLGDPKEPFFFRFVLFVKNEHSFVLVGFGIDEIYYLVAAWNKNEDEVGLWEPKVLRNSTQEVRA